MDERDLSREIGLWSKPGFVRTALCPGEYVLAQVAAGTLPADVLADLTPHLAACDYCLARIGELVRLEAKAASAAVPDLLIARAARLGVKTPPARLISRARPQLWAAAAVVALAFALLLERPWDAATGPEATEDAARTGDAATVRRVDPDAMRPQITWPTAGMSIDPRDAAIRWTPVVGSLYYDVQLLSDAGDVLWRRRVDENTAILPESLSLTPGQEYFLRVDAYLAEARSVSSQHVVFSVSAPSDDGWK